MTSLDKIERASIAPAAAAIAPGRHLSIEFAETLKLAVPMALTQLGQIAMMTTDLALIGRLGDQAVAAAALASTVFFVSFTFGMGLVSAVAPLAAQAFGARDPHRVRRALRVGLWAAFLISLPMMAFPLLGEKILLLLGQAPTPARLAQQYLFGVVWGATPALWLIAMRGFMGALNRPEPVLWITLVAVPANALLVYFLINGTFGLPQLGLFGAGLATTIVNCGMFLAGLWFAAYRRPFSKYHVLGHVCRIDGAGVARAGLVAGLLGVGLGAVVTAAVIFGRFTIARLFLGHTAENAAATIDLAATLLLVGTTLFVTDGLQGIAAGALRGLKDTRKPLLFAFIGYWLVGFPAAWTLAFHAGLGAVGVWIGLSLGTAVYATLLTL